MYYSKSMNAFYIPEKMMDYKIQNVWPDDAVLVPENTANEFIGEPPAGKIRLAGPDGLPFWADIPPLTHGELIAYAEEEKRSRIASANYYINNKQWPSRLALGRLSGSEVDTFIMWLDYVDALDAVDTTTAPDIEWPTPLVDETRLPGPA